MGRVVALDLPARGSGLSFTISTAFNRRAHLQEFREAVLMQRLGLKDRAAPDQHMAAFSGVPSQFWPFITSLADW